jgi:hypothetical protein
VSQIDSSEKQNKKSKGPAYTTTTMGDVTAFKASFDAEFSKERKTPRKVDNSGRKKSKRGGKKVNRQDSFEDLFSGHAFGGGFAKSDLSSRSARTCFTNVGEGVGHQSPSQMSVFEAPFSQSCSALNVGSLFVGESEDEMSVEQGEGRFVDVVPDPGGPNGRNRSNSLGDEASFDGVSVDFDNVGFDDFQRDAEDTTELAADHDLEKSFSWKKPMANMEEDEAKYSDELEGSFSWKKLSEDWQSPPAQNPATKKLSRKVPLSTVLNSPRKFITPASSVVSKDSKSSRSSKKSLRNAFDTSASKLFKQNFKGSLGVSKSPKSTTSPTGVMEQADFDPFSSQEQVQFESFDGQKQTEGFQEVDVRNVNSLPQGAEVAGAYVMAPRAVSRRSVSRARVTSRAASRGRSKSVSRVGRNSSSENLPTLLNNEGNVEEEDFFAMSQPNELSNSREKMVPDTGRKRVQRIRIKVRGSQKIDRQVARRLIEEKMAERRGKQPTSETGNATELMMSESMADLAHVAYGDSAHWSQEDTEDLPTHSNGEAVDMKTKGPSSWQGSHSTPEANREKLTSHKEEKNRVDAESTTAATEETDDQDSSERVPVKAATVEYETPDAVDEEDEGQKLSLEGINESELEAAVRAAVMSNIGGTSQLKPSNNADEASVLARLVQKVLEVSDSMQPKGATPGQWISATMETLRINSVVAVNEDFADTISALELELDDVLIKKATMNCDDTSQPNQDMASSVPNEDEEEVDDDHTVKSKKKKKKSKKKGEIDHHDSFNSSGLLTERSKKKKKHRKKSEHEGDVLLDDDQSVKSKGKKKKKSKKKEVSEIDHHDSFNSSGALTEGSKKKKKKHRKKSEEGEDTLTPLEDHHSAKADGKEKEHKSRSKSTKKSRPGRSESPKKRSKDKDSKEGREKADRSESPKKKSKD